MDWRLTVTPYKRLTLAQQMIEAGTRYRPASKLSAALSHMLRIEEVEDTSITGTNTSTQVYTTTGRMHH